MALIHFAAVVSGIALITGCRSPAAVCPPASSAPVEQATAQGPSTAVGGPSDNPCSVGQVSDEVPRMEMETLLANPEPYYGRELVLRGYFILEDVETTALLEPKR